MSWSSIAKKNCPAVPPSSPIKIQQKEVKNDYWSDPKFDCNWKTIEQQTVESFQKLGLEVPKSVYGRASLLDFTK
tara:strand:+ start:885 stop:1109 length:225 start_codon:yes stop_codon:yes gene_type:complete